MSTDRLVGSYHRNQTPIESVKNAITKMLQRKIINVYRVSRINANDINKQNE
jgi:hypothetical protein